MKRILFYYDNYCGDSSHGGTEVATARIARALAANEGWETYHASKRNRDKAPSSPYRAEKIVRGRNFIPDLAEFIRENEIDAVVNMGRFYRHKKLEKAILLSGREAKLLFMHHFAPGHESTKHTWKAGLHLLRLDPFNPAYWARATVYPVIKLQRRLCLKGMYRKVLERSDAIVLLSDSYKEQYLRVAYGKNAASPAAVKQAEKLFAIPNIYEAPEHTGKAPKEKRVLILSRMDEIQKQISMALKIWRQIEATPDLADWSMDIVGTGDDMKSLEKLSRRLGLKRAEFHGWKDSRPFLERDSILLSTSAYEGLSLAMIEALHYGCVPVALESYSSLRDIVADGATGIAVPSGSDPASFASRLRDLMLDDSLRNRMALNASDTLPRFSANAVAKRWILMLNQLLPI